MILVRVTLKFAQLSFIEADLGNADLDKMNNIIFVSLTLRQGYISDTQAGILSLKKHCRSW